METNFSMNEEKLKTLHGFKPFLGFLQKKLKTVLESSTNNDARYETVSRCLKKVIEFYNILDDKQKTENFLKLEGHYDKCVALYNSLFENYGKEYIVSISQNLEPSSNKVENSNNVPKKVVTMVSESSESKTRKRSDKRFASPSKKYSNSPKRGRSPNRWKQRYEVSSSPKRRRSRTPRRYRSRSPRRSRSRSPRWIRSRSPRQHGCRSPSRGVVRVAPRIGEKVRSPLRGRKRSPDSREYYRQLEPYHSRIPKIESPSEVGRSYPTSYGSSNIRSFPDQKYSHNSSLKYNSYQKERSSGAKLVDLPPINNKLKSIDESKIQNRKADVIELINQNGSSSTIKDYSNLKVEIQPKDDSKRKVTHEPLSATDLCELQMENMDNLLDQPLEYLEIMKKTIEKGIIETNEKNRKSVWKRLENEIPTTTKNIHLNKSHQSDDNKKFKAFRIPKLASIKSKDEVKPKVITSSGNNKSPEEEELFDLTKELLGKSSPKPVETKPKVSTVIYNTYIQHNNKSANIPNINQYPACSFGGALVPMNQMNPSSVNQFIYPNASYTIAPFLVPNVINQQTPLNNHFNVQQETNVTKENSSKTTATCSSTVTSNSHILEMIKDIDDPSLLKTIEIVVSLHELKKKGNDDDDDAVQEIIQRVRRKSVCLTRGNDEQNAESTIDASGESCKMKSSTSKGKSDLDKMKRIRPCRINDDSSDDSNTKSHSSRTQTRSLSEHSNHSSIIDGEKSNSVVNNKKRQKNEVDKLNEANKDYLKNVNIVSLYGPRRCRKNSEYNENASSNLPTSLTYNEQENNNEADDDIENQELIPSFEDGGLLVECTNKKIAKRRKSSAAVMTLHKTAAKKTKSAKELKVRNCVVKIGPIPEMKLKQLLKKFLSNTPLPKKNLYVKIMDENLFQNIHKDDIICPNGKKNPQKCRFCSYTGPCMVTHLRRTHPKSEVFISRYSRKLAAMIRSNPNMGIYKDNECLACNMKLMSVYKNGITHLISHTGECPYECTKCGKKFVSYKDTHNKICDSNNVNVLIPGLHRTKTAYMCNLCNFTQILRPNIEKHLLTQHKLPSVEKDHYTEYYIQENNNNEVVKPVDIIENIKLEIDERDDLPIDEVQEDRINSDEGEKSDPVSIYKLSKRTPNGIVLQKVSPKTSIKNREEENYAFGNQISPTIVNESSSVEDLKTDSLNDDPIEMELEIVDEVEGVSSETPMESNIGIEPLNDNIEKVKVKNEIYEIENISLLKNLDTNSIEFYCDLEGCSSMKFSDLTNLQFHIMASHYKDIWTGYCGICEHIVKVGNLRLKDEFKHLKEDHADDIVLTGKRVPNIVPISRGVSADSPLKQINVSCGNSDKSISLSVIKNGATVIRVTPKNASEINTDNDGSIWKPNIEVVNQVKHVTSVPDVNQKDLSQDNKNASPAKAIGVIKLRRLSGDKLSGKCSKITIEPPVIDTTSNFDFINLDEVKDVIGDAALNCNTIADFPISVNKLNPWLNSNSTKLGYCCDSLLSESSLYALYKCMSNSCSFYTNNQLAFEKHLNEHSTCISEKFLENWSWLDCAYCGVRTDTITQLIEHIDDMHYNEIFQCKYCFYRAKYPYNVNNHINRYHFGKPIKILICYGTIENEIWFKNEILEMINRRYKYVIPISCKACKKSFYIIDAYIQHMKDHNKYDIDKRIPCPTCAYLRLPETDIKRHLLSHNIGIFSCINCCYATDNINGIRKHMAENHDRSILFAVVRSGRPKANPSLISSLLFVFIGTLEPDQYEKCPYPEYRPRDLDSSQIDEYFESAIKSNERFICTSLYSNSEILPNQSTNSKVSAQSSKSQNSMESIEEFIRAANEVYRHTGFTEKQLNCCIIPDCNKNFATTKELFDHILSHGPQKDYYRCSLCNVFNTSILSQLKSHIRKHAIHRHLCFYCSYSTSVLRNMFTHIEQSHGVSNHCVINLSNETIDASIDSKIGFKIYLDRKVVSDQSSMTIINEFGRGLIEKFNDIQVKTKREYNHTEKDQLPTQSIFSAPLQCIHCGYSTKVRINLHRHLQAHSNDQIPASVAPINPVLASNASEHHFDKMINLAYSSNEVNVNIQSDKLYTSHPVFIPLVKRFKCNISNCNFVASTEQVLKKHLEDRHDKIFEYKCLHCGWTVVGQKDRIIKTKTIIKHLRFHQSKVYECGYCNFVHYKLSDVVKHCELVHALESIKIKPVDRSKISDVITNKNPSEQFLYTCTFCIFSCEKEATIINHNLNEHQMKYRYYCAECYFGTDTHSGIVSHWNALHNDIDICPRYNKYYCLVKDTESNSNTIVPVEIKSM